MATRIKRRMIKDKEKLIEMYHQMGMSLTDIARKYGCSRQYVQLVFIDLGIKRRKRRDALNVSPKRRKSKHSFNEIHDRFIVKNYLNLTDREMARYLNKPAAAVTYRRLMVLGRKKMERRNFSLKEDRYIIKNYRYLSDSVMARALDRSLISVTHHRSRILNCPKKRGRKFSVQNDAVGADTGLPGEDFLNAGTGYSEARSRFRPFSKFSFGSSGGSQER